MAKQPRTLAGIEVVSIGGSKNFGSFLERYSPHGSTIPLAGLYDVGEESDVLRGLERSGFGTGCSASSTTWS